MRPFVRATLKKLAPIELADLVAEQVKQTGCTPEEARAAIEDASHDEFWLNNVYQVNRRYFHQPGGGPIVHLSIKRRDKRPVGVEHFRDFQEIKNLLVGPECEGIELYPAEARLVDSSNQYHLWVVADPEFRFPFGFTSRQVDDSGKGPWKQRPFTSRK